MKENKSKVDNLIRDQITLEPGIVRLKKLKEELKGKTVSCLFVLKLLIILLLNNISLMCQVKLEDEILKLKVDYRSDCLNDLKRTKDSLESLVNRHKESEYENSCVTNDLNQLRSEVKKLQKMDEKKCYLKNKISSLDGLLKS